MSSSSTGDRPNVLLVLSDQHRGMALNCAGTDQVISPNFDRLAADGMRFANAYANYPLCSPSRACIQTGQYPLSHGMLTNRLQPLPEDVPSIAKAFRDAGYRTGYVGKWDLDGWGAEKFVPPGSRRQGYDDFWAAQNHRHEYFDARYHLDSPDPVRIDGYEPAAQTDLALEFATQDDERPFFLCLSWGPPHDPYHQVPDRYRDLYDPGAITLRDNVEPVLPAPHTLDDPNSLVDNLRSPHPDPSLIDGPPIRHWGGGRTEYDHPREVLADYYAAITALDDQMGRIIDRLGAAELREETALVYTSDHGANLWSHGKTQKENPYEESISIPFLVQWPGVVPGGTVSETLFSTVDIAPSLLGLAGVDPPEGMEGTDRSGTMRGRSEHDPESVFLMNIRNGWRGVRTDRYTYARVGDWNENLAHLPGGEWLLFDNQADPYQHQNRIYDADYESERARLARQLDDWLGRCGDEFVSVEAHIRSLGIDGTRLDDAIGE